MKMANPFSRLPYWLREALGLKDQDVPAALAVNSVCPVVETFQRGYVYSQHFGGNFSQPQNTAGQQQIIKNFADNYNLVLMGMAVSANGGVADVRVELRVITPDQASVITVDAVDAPNGQSTPMPFSVRRPIWVPASMFCAFITPATGAGETIVVDWWEIHIPPAFIPTPF